MLVARDGEAALAAARPGDARRHPARRADARAVDGFETCRRIKAQPALGAHPGDLHDRPVGDRAHRRRLRRPAASTTWSSRCARRRCWRGWPRTCATHARCGWRARRWTSAGWACWWSTRTAAWPGARRRRSAGWREFFAGEADARLRRLAAGRRRRTADAAARAPTAARWSARRLGDVGLGETMWLLRVRAPASAGAVAPGHRGADAARDRGAVVDRQGQDQPRRRPTSWA